jgi:hypothetical protein
MAGSQRSDEYLYELDEIIDLCHIYLNGGKEHGISKIEVWCTNWPRPAGADSS